MEGKKSKYGSGFKVNGSWFMINGNERFKVKD